MIIPKSESTGELLTTDNASVVARLQKRFPVMPPKEGKAPAPVYSDTTVINILAEGHKQSLEMIRGNAIQRAQNEDDLKNGLPKRKQISPLALALEAEQTGCKTCGGDDPDMQFTDKFPSEKFPIAEIRNLLIEEAKATFALENLWSKKREAIKRHNLNIDDYRF